MKIQKLLIAPFLLLMLPTASIFANEINQSFGDRSWQFKSPSDKLIDNQRLVLRCQADPDSCPDDFATANGGGGAGGPGLANGQSVGNVTNVIVSGEGNSVTVTTNQDNSGNQSVDQNVTDNVLDIDNDTQILNGDIAGNVESSDNSIDAPIFNTTPTNPQEE